MRLHIESCKASGQTVIAYCHQHGLAPSKFYYWQKRLQDADVSSGFLQIPDHTTHNATASIHFPNGVSISFAGNVSIDVLKELACCI